MGAHDLLDCRGGLVAVVEWDGGDVVVRNVGFNDAVEDVSADEAEVAVDCGGCSAGEVPGLIVIMRERWVGVLEEGDGD